jgi:hypothetical protein
LITAVIQVVLGIVFVITIPYGDPPLLAGFFLLLLTNFAVLSIRDIGYPTAIIAGTFFTFLIVIALGELDHQIPRKSSPRDQEEALKHE